MERRNSMILQRILAENVLFLRKEMGISQEKLAEICGYHRTYIGAIERGERNVTLSTIEALSFAFGINPYQLLVPNKNE